MSAIRWRKGVRLRGLCHPPACCRRAARTPGAGATCASRAHRAYLRSRATRAPRAFCPCAAHEQCTRCSRVVRVLPRARAQLRPLRRPRPGTCPPASCVPSHPRLRTAHTISIRRLAWGRTRVKGGSGGARAFRLLLSRAGELYTAVRRFGLEVFQLPPSHEGELEIRIPSGRHMNISTPALTRGRTTPQSHNHQTRRFQLPPYEKRSPHIRGERSER